MWDPQQYLVYADQRARPFHDLVDRVDAQDPQVVVDLGCGPGGLTAGLADRWRQARVVGVDSSAEMIERARQYERDRVEFVQADLRLWTPAEPVDVLLSNATLQWVPGHLELLARLAPYVAPGGWFAFQIPGNFAEPTHVELRDLAASSPWAERLDVTWPYAHDPRDYAEALLDAGLAVDVWETTYHHLLAGPDDVLEWLRGSALRPIVNQLGEADSAAFVEQFRERLHRAYPAGRHGSIMPYRRIFAVAQRPRP
ncbi:methyltransferase domain-containing protein [Phytoactinopolyspora halotolerans]|uniref:Methyltransferase domain-containing protein n=1 Tax=Phytoactinopolyspora halotolerans TaxID=1981512 RepID=A0A6L9S501_9ACTN|nr:methyltransferase domain-containing protein [Phytoactinopolyspora halotolerans]NED99577.1 methyltransferase domain-containing protein [Phytoactinopolyspora halotolerans]